VADRVRIADDGWELLPRIAVALGCRMLIRGMPLLRSKDWNQPAREVVRNGRNFSLGVQVDPFKIQADTRNLLKKMENLIMPGDDKISWTISHATLHLGKALNVAIEAMVLAESQYPFSELSERLVSAGKIALEARDSVGEAISSTATGSDDDKKITSALKLERMALESYRKSELSRLDPADEVDPAQIGPSFDLSGLGPLGALWPVGAPSWYRVADTHSTGVVLERNFSPKERGDATVVAYYKPEGDVSGFLKDALAFTADVLKSTPEGGVPLTPCVYVPPTFTGRDHSVVIGKLVSAGAVPLDDNDLSAMEKPQSPEDFAHAIVMLHRNLLNPGQPNSVNLPVMAFAPTKQEPVPPLDDKRWKRVPSTAASYESLIRRSSDEATDGWPAAE